MKTKLRLLVCLVVAVCLTVAFSVPAFAYAESNDDTPLTTLAPTPTPAPTPAPVVSSSALTPSGNLTLVDDYDGTTKQFITVETRNGNFYYIVIDRSGNSDNVYFLDKVDEADLLKIMEKAGDELPAVCTCTDKCVAGDVNTSCPVCKANMSECKGVTKPDATEQPDSPNSSQNDGAIKKTVLFIVLVAIFGVGSFVCCVKLRKGKDDGKGKTDLDNYDFGEDDDDEEEYETETDDASK